MASVSEMLVGSALQSADKAPDISGAIESGVGLAMKVRQVQQQQQELDRKKQEHEQAKLEKAASWFKTAADMPDGAAKKAFVNNYIPNGIKALGLADKIDPNSMQMLQGDPNLAGYVGHLVATHQADLGLLNSPDGLAAAAADPKYQQFLGQQELAKTTDAEELKAKTKAMLQNTLTEYGPKTLGEQQKKAYEESESNSRNRETARAALGKQIQDQNATPKVTVAKKVAEDYVADQAAGGAARDKRQLDVIDEAIKSLTDKKVSSGGLSTKTPLLSSSVGQSIANPKLLALRNKVLSTFSLKELTGDPNPTETQIEDAKDKVFNAKLTNDDVIDQLKSFRAQKVAAQKAKAKQFRDQGLVVDDTAAATKIPPDKMQQFKALKPENRDRALQRFVELYGIDIKEVKRQLGVK